MQKKIGHIFATLLFFISANSLAQEEIVLTGVFKGDPIFIQNPYHPGLKNFCINSIEINDKLLDIDYSLSAINLDFKGIDLYSPVKISINHKNVCKPVIVNKEAILFHSSFKFTDLVLNDSLMVWTTKGDRSGAVFEVEKLYADGWSLLRTIHSTGKFQGDRYECVPELDEGANKFRIKYKVNENRYLYSSELELEYYPEPVELITATVANIIRFNRVSDFRIEDQSGQTVLAGNGKAINISHLKAGEYFIYFDETPVRFLKNTK